jgi:hypothetical protein
MGLRKDNCPHLTGKEGFLWDYGRGIFGEGLLGLTAAKMRLGNISSVGSL